MSTEEVVEETTTPDLTAYEGLRQSNHGRYKALTEKGIGIAPGQVTNLQIEALLDLLGDEARTAWAFLFETRMAEMFDEIEAKADEALARQKLLGPGGQPFGSKILAP
jgi:hypothetical protein